MLGRRVGAVVAPVVAWSLCIAGGAWAAGQAGRGQQPAAAQTATQSTAKQPDLGGTWGPYQGRGGRGGRGADPLAEVNIQTPALKGDYAKRYAERRALEAAATQRGEPLATTSAACMPQGVPTMMRVAFYPIEVIQTPKQVTIIGEAFSEVRRIYIDKAQEKMGDVPPLFYGRSVGRWEGETLVVDTIGIKETVLYKGIPHSDEMRITERFSLAAPDVLHDEVKIEDPLALESPLTYRLSYSRMKAGYEMVEFVCENNQEYVDEKGVVRLRLREQ